MYSREVRLPLVSIQEENYQGLKEELERVLSKAKQNVR